MSAPPHPFEFDPRRPLDRYAETTRAHAALRDYYALGPGRSFDGLLESYKSWTKQPPSRQLATIKDWSRYHAWQARVLAQELLDQADEARLWAQRRRRINEDDYALGERVRQLAHSLLDQAPNFIRKKTTRIPAEISESGVVLTPEQIIITLAIDASVIPRLVKAASDLQRLGAGLETERVALDWRAQLEVAQLDPDQVQGEIIELLARQLESGAETPKSG